jgi:CheY-like chemotaxis protein
MVLRGAHVEARAEPQAAASVLIAEDDTAVRELLARVLRIHGFHVVAVANGVEALLAAADQGTPFELLLTDLMMPRMGGLDLAAHMLGQGFARRVILMTGYADVPLDPQLFSTVLQKPFSPSTLAAAVRAALSR